MYSRYVGVAAAYPNASTIAQSAAGQTRRGQRQRLTAASPHKRMCCGSNSHLPSTPIFCRTIASADLAPQLMKRDAADQNCRPSAAPQSSRQEAISPPAGTRPASGYAARGENQKTGTTAAIGSRTPMPIPADSPAMKACSGRCARPSATRPYAPSRHRLTTAVLVTARLLIISAGDEQQRNNSVVRTSRASRQTIHASSAADSAAVATSAPGRRPAMAQPSRRPREARRWGHLRKKTSAYRRCPSHVLRRGG